MNQHDEKNYREKHQMENMDAVKVYDVTDTSESMHSRDILGKLRSFLNQ
ncbi:hypothetical protein [Paucisalibacillus globulus]|nr:hypothetical protein [Paucisalibacillus globulus]